MRASTARLMNSPVRLADLTFPQVNRLIHRTRLAFVHLDNLLAFGKRDRDGRVDGYITAYLPEECLLLFFRKGEAVNAASLHTTGRQVITITEALKRMRAEVERGELAYAAAPMEQLAWMYQSCAAPIETRVVDATHPEAFFPVLTQEKVTGSRPRSPRRCSRRSPTSPSRPRTRWSIPTASCTGASWTRWRKSSPGRRS